MMIDVYSQYNETLSNLWEIYKPEDLGFPIEHGELPLIHRSYCGPAEVAKGGLLFLGLNPSFSKKESKTKAAGLTSWEIDEQSIPYFKSFFNIWNKSTYKAKGIPVAALDMFFVRETSQKKVLDMIRTSNGREFLASQLEVFGKVLEECRPLVIISANSAVRKLLSEGIKLNKKDFLTGLGYSIEFDESMGTHKIQMNDTNQSVPLFLTSMLSGQRALDIGSRRRLMWHLKWLFEQGLLPKKI